MCDYKYQKDAESRVSRFFIAGHSVECPFLLKINKRGVIEVVESKSYISIPEFGRKYKYDPDLLRRLINQYNIKPDFRAGNTKLFKEERLKVIVQDLDGMLRKEN